MSSNGRHCLSLAEWPENDRRAWSRITEAPVSFLDDAGPLANLRPATLHKRMDDYGRWLAFLAFTNRVKAGQSPGDRAVDTVVQDYVTMLHGHVSSFTVWSYVVGLYVVMSAMEPNRDWSWLRCIVNRLQRRTRPERKLEHRILPAAQLFEAGLRRMRDAEKRPPRLPLDQSSWYRDGLMIAFLIARPVRRRNLANIRIGHNLIRLADGYRFHFPAEETKTNSPLDFPLPVELKPWMDRWLDHHRPLLLQGNDSDLLWISNLGQGMTVNSVAARVCEVTEKLFGVWVSPHLLRKSAATTAAIERPEEVAIVMTILGHSIYRTGERYYVQASTVAASRRYGDSLSRRRRRLRNQFGV